MIQGLGIINFRRRRALDLWIYQLQKTFLLRMVEGSTVAGVVDKVAAEDCSSLRNFRSSEVALNCDDRWNCRISVSTGTFMTFTFFCFLVFAI